MKGDVLILSMRFGCTVLIMSMKGGGGGGGIFVLIYIPRPAKTPRRVCLL